VCAAHHVLSRQLVGQQTTQCIIQLHCRRLLVHIDAWPVGARHTRTADMDEPGSSSSSSRVEGEGSRVEREVAGFKACQQSLCWQKKEEATSTGEVLSQCSY